MLTRLEQFLFYSLCIAIPFQIRSIFYFSGWRFNEWQSMAVWGTDILLITLLVLWFVQSVRHKEISFQVSIDYRSAGFWLFVFIAFAAISIKAAPLPYLAWYAWARIVVFVLFYFYLRRYAHKHFTYTRAALAFVAGGFFQGVVAIMQFQLQHHVGFHWFGEGILNPSTPGTAVFYNFSGEKIMRAYGTTPHPNILAGYLLISIFACYFLWAWHGSMFKDKRFARLFYIGYAVILSAFFLTFSRTAIGIWALASAGLWLWARYYEKSLYLLVQKLLVLTCIVSLLFSAVYWKEVASRILVSRTEEAVQLRIYFAQESVDQGVHWFGVGAGNFVKWLMLKTPGKPDWMYQPVHNIYLLIYSELGFMSLAAFLIFLTIRLKNFLHNNFTATRKIFILTIVGSLLSIAFFDHYYLTMQQGRFIWWLVLSLL